MKFYCAFLYFLSKFEVYNIILKKKSYQVIRLRQALFVDYLKFHMRNKVQNLMAMLFYSRIYIYLPMS